jgi:uncharacterized iron-regulated membrane protein
MSGVRWYRTVWRWHFYAGLFCIPFILWLAVTGSIYLWKPQIERLIDRPYDNLEVATSRHSPSEIVGAALASQPGAALAFYELPETPRSAARVVVGQGARKTRVYVDPYSLSVLKSVDEDERLMRTVFKLHGELLMGKRGSYLVELAASWAIVMILTGIYLWWPRQRKGLAGVLWPRLGSGGRRFWRDIHAVTGIWVSFFALFLLLSGLPWATSWGAYLKEIRSVTGTAVARQDWSTGSPDARDVRLSQDAGPSAIGGEHAQHAGMATVHPPQSYRDLDRVAAAAAPLKLASPVLIAPPIEAGRSWTVRSDAANRPLRTTLHIDGTSGRVLSREDFKDRHLIDRIVGTGIAAHEGQLFGLANQLLGMATAFGLITLAVSSTVLWWRRRPEGVLGAPVPLTRPRFGGGLIALIGGLALILPLLGISLLAVLLIERVALRRWSAAAKWLGLEAEHA